MPAVPAGGKVLVSGANGFIAVWIVRDLLQKGYSVRGTVRSEAKAKFIRTLFANYGEKCEIVIVPDITKAGAFDTAVQGVDAIEHTSSPFHFDADDPNELIEPALKGTQGILESALKYAGPGLKRVVVLSSTASVVNPSDTGSVDESHWNTENITEIEEKGREASQLAKYRASKSLAERSAWDFVEKHKSEIQWDLVTLCPPFVFGPVLHEVATPDALGTSDKDFFYSVIKHTKTAEQLKTFQGGWIDVRDVSLAHVLAIEKEDAGGKRFIIASGMFVWQDWFDTVNVLSIPGIVAPDENPGFGKKVNFKFKLNNAKAQKELGIKFRDMATTAKDTIENFKEKKWC